LRASKQEQQEALDNRKREEWREFAVNMASMRAQERVRKPIPTLLTKAAAPQVQREVFYKHIGRNKPQRRGSAAMYLEAAAKAAVQGGSPEDYIQIDEAAANDDDDSDEEPASSLELMQNAMNEQVMHNHGQKPLFSVFFEFLKMEYQTNHAFIALKEGPPGKEHLRIVAAYADDVGPLLNFTIDRSDENDQPIWDCIASGSAQVVEDGSVLSCIDNNMIVPFLFAAATKPSTLTGSDEDTKSESVAVIGVALPQLAIPQPAEGEEEVEIARSSAKEKSSLGEEEDEEEMQRREMIESIEAGAAVLGVAVVQAWRHLDEPRKHRMQLAVSEAADHCIENVSIAAQNSQKLARKCAKLLQEDLSTEDSPVSVIISVMDDTHEKLWVSATEVSPGHSFLNGVPMEFSKNGFEEDAVWQACTTLAVSNVRDTAQFSIHGLTIKPAEPQPVEEGEEPGPPPCSYAAMVVPLVVPPDEPNEEELELIDESDLGFCVGCAVVIRQAKEVPIGYDPDMDADVEQGFTSDERAVGDAMKGPSGSALHAVQVIEGFEHVLHGLLRRYAGEYVGEKPLAQQLEPQFKGPMAAQFRRQVGQEVMDAVIHSDRIHPLTVTTELCGMPIKPDMGAGQPPVSLAFASQQKTPEAQIIADEVKEVASIALPAVCNNNHRSSLEFQGKARICRRWLLAAEALLRYQRLQLGRLTESEVNQLEPRNEPEMANRCVITAVLTLLNELDITQVALWKKCRNHLGAPMMQKVVDFDPTASTVQTSSVRDAIKLFKQVLPYKADMWPAAAALHDWLGAVFWVRKEMRAVAGIVQNTTVEGVIQKIKEGNVVAVRNVLEVDLFSAEGHDEYGRTPLHHAAIHAEGHEAMVELILSMDGAPSMINKVDNDGKLPMHHAVERKLPSMVRQLTRVNSELEVIDGNQMTPLMHAVESRNLGLVQQLLDANADPNAITSKGSAMDLAAGWDDALSVLQEYGAMTSGALGIRSKKGEAMDQEEDDLAEEYGEEGYGEDMM